MIEYGSSAYRVYNQTLKIIFGEAEKQLESLKKQIQTSNLARKTEQTRAGSKLTNMEQKYLIF